MDALKTLYPRISTLCEYFEAEGFQNVLLCTDKPGFRSFIQTTIVAEIPKNQQFNSGPVDTSCCSRLKDVVAKAVEILTNCSDQKRNVLLFGKNQVDSAFISTNRSLLDLPPWHLLLTRVRKEVIIRLLVSTSVFISAPQACYIQVCGLPVYDLVSSPSRTLKPGNEKKGQSPSGPQPAQTAFSMMSVCYKRVGSSKLPKKHPLESLRASNTGARALLTLVIPGETSKKPTKHCSIKSAKFHRMRRRFIPMQTLLKEMLKAHKAMNLRTLLDGNCPISQSDTTGEMSMSLPSQKDLLGSTIEPWRVYLFLRGCLLKAVPFLVWGSLHNRSAFFKFVEKFTKLGRHEKLELNELMEEIRVVDCKWTQLKIRKGHSTCRSDDMMQIQMVSCLMSWLMSEYVMALIKVTFYITETSSSRGGVVYYRKATWNRLEAYGLKECLDSDILKPVSSTMAESLLGSKACFGLSRLRFVPKTTGLRSVINMKKKQLVGMKPGISINTLLEDAYDILKHHRCEKPSDLGSSIFSVNEAHQKWRQFVSQTKKKADQRPLYFVKVDITQCFDSIPHGAMFDVICKIIKPEQRFTVYRYVTVSKGSFQGRRMFHRYLHPHRGPHITFHEALLQMAHKGTWKNTILVNQVSSRTLFGEHAMSSLKRHISCDIIKFNDQYFMRQKGIPQGSVISSWLCNYFYAAMETSCLPHLQQDELMMRLQDDFLLVTPNRHKAEHFLRILLDGLPQYGCHANLSKTLTNFPFEFNGRQVQSIPPRDMFPWCGLLLNMENLNICNDYARYKDVRIRYTLTMDYSGNIIRKIKKKLLQTLQSTKSTRLFLDPEINCPATIRRNCYEMLLISAYRFHSLWRSRPHKVKLSVTKTKKLFRLTDKLANKLCKLGIPFSKFETKWLSLKAFHTKLQHHQTSYRQLLKLLERAERGLSKYLAKADVEALEKASTPAIPDTFKDMRT